MAPISSEQLAGVLQRGANMRRDVRKARIVVAEDDPGMLLVDVVYDSGRKLQREAAAAKCFDGRTCGEIIAAWLGEAPEDSRLESETVHAARRQMLEHTPADVVELMKKHRQNPPPAPPRSKFNWKKPGELAENPEGVLPSPIPEQPTEAGRLTRQQMIDAGMDEKARHEQYKRQGGKAPADTDAESPA